MTDTTFVIVLAGHRDVSGKRLHIPIDTKGILQTLKARGAGSLEHFLKKWLVDKGLGTVDGFLPLVGMATHDGIAELLQMMHQYLKSSLAILEMRTTRVSMRDDKISHLGYLSASKKRYGNAEDIDPEPLNRGLHHMLPLMLMAAFWFSLIHACYDHL